MTSNYSTIEVEKENNRVKNVNITFNTLRIYTTLYITLTNYYIVMGTFTWQVITASKYFSTYLSSVLCTC